MPVALPSAARAARVRWQLHAGMRPRPADEGEGGGGAGEKRFRGGVTETMAHQPKGGSQRIRVVTTNPRAVQCELYRLIIRGRGGADTGAWCWEEDEGGRSYRRWTEQAGEGSLGWREHS
jgi:hypothetical protein